MTDRRILLVLLCTLAAAVVVGTAWLFELVGGFEPCALCLTQRDPYYGAIPLGLLALTTMLWPAPPSVPRAAMLIFGLLMTLGLTLAIYHAGVEWQVWAGPETCGAGRGPSDAASMLQSLQEGIGPSCTEAAGRFFGLSFAGWNVLASLALAALAFRAASMPYGSSSTSQ